jgi:AraC family transcriptional regulator of adaptative response/methylated-DNA-[protein]-cysteine methyltransferase
VLFFDQPHDARTAGYRACKRCAPDRSAAADPWIDKVRRATVYLSNVGGHFSLAQLAARIGGSPYHLQRNFKRIVGLTPREYADARRLESVKRRLQAGGDVTGAMLDAGYGSSSRFYERAAPKLGMLPTTYRRGGIGQRISFATVESPLGRLLVAATERGVCSVTMGSSDAALVTALRREFPAAAIDEDAGGLSKWTTSILAHLEGRAPRLDLPLDIQATAFQWQVWQALTTIPYGETRTYGEVARAIGQPRAVRAVARACASNRVALAIPCRAGRRRHGRLPVGRDQEKGASGPRAGARAATGITARARAPIARRSGSQAFALRGSRAFALCPCLYNGPLRQLTIDS